MKGTTTARMMGAFWALLAASPAIASFFQVDATALMPLLESSLTGFVGIGSVLLLVGPAYREYREACEASLEGRAELGDGARASAGRSVKHVSIWVGLLIGLAALRSFRSSSNRKGI